MLSVICCLLAQGKSIIKLDKPINYKDLINLV
jgi:hypothetical protein